MSFWINNMPKYCYSFELTIILNYGVYFQHHITVQKFSQVFLKFELVFKSLKNVPHGDLLNARLKRFAKI